MPFTPRVRALLIVLVFACAAVGAGVIVLGHQQDTSEASPGKPGPPAVTPKRHAASRPAAKAPSARSARRASPAADQLPQSIQQALAANRIVVVSLVDPKAKIDHTAMREAAAGALLTGTTFVLIDVTQNDVDSLNARYGVIQDPAVLVLRPPGDLVVRIDGFADRDTVAQAAANAGS